VRAAAAKGSHPTTPRRAGISLSESPLTISATKRRQGTKRTCPLSRSPPGGSGECGYVTADERTQAVAVAAKALGRVR